jgi:hypothetical protein
MYNYSSINSKTGCTSKKAGISSKSSNIGFSHQSSRKNNRNKMEANTAILVVKSIKRDHEHNEL